MTERIPVTPADYDRARIIERPDGFFWQDKTTDQIFGPFASLLEAVNDMEYKDDTDYEPGETLEEAEAELGISDWIDPDTGLPGEESHFLGD